MNHVFRDARAIVLNTEVVFHGLRWGMEPKKRAEIYVKMMFYHPFQASDQSIRTLPMIQDYFLGSMLCAQSLPTKQLMGRYDRPRPVMI